MPGNELINCPFCRREVEDTKAPVIQCKWCGKKFRRVQVFNEDEKALRQGMIIDLSLEMSKYKTMRVVGVLMGFVTLIIAVIFLFSEEFPVWMWGLVGAGAACTAGWWVVSFLNDRKYNETQSKLFDLSGGRRVD